MALKVIMDYTIMDLDEILSNYESPYMEGGEKLTWEKTFAQEAETQVVKSLVAELQERGEFDEPIALYSSYLDDDPMDDELETEFIAATVGKGVHRLTAHYLTGNKQVKVVVDPDSPETPERSYVFVVTVRYEGNDDFFFDKVFCEMSYRSMTTGEWVEREWVSTPDTTDQSIYDIHFATRLTAEQARAVADEVMSLLSTVGVETTLIGARRKVYAAQEDGNLLVLRDDGSVIGEVLDDYEAWRYWCEMGFKA